MKLFLRILTITALAVATAHPAAAQNAPGLLNTFEVQQLVAADTPDAHAVLAKHFIALTAAYKADAARYSALANAYIGNPNHTAGVDVAARRMRQAQEATANAKIARAVTAYHQILSIGGMAMPPAGAAAFDGGKGAPAPRFAQLNEFGKSARTSAEHRVLAEYYLSMARNEMSNANTYATMAELSRVNGSRNAAVTATYGERLAHRAREVARQANAAAQLHRQLANIG
jgi:hypothetical protein